MFVYKNLRAFIAARLNASHTHIKIVLDLMGIPLYRCLLSSCLLSYSVVRCIM